MTLSIRKLALASALPLALALSAPAMAQDATVDQVYSAAKAGQTDKALELMQPVLKDHPGSGKAHYVEAELLAKAGRLDEARTELAKAEQLKPGLPFAKASAVAELKQQLSAGGKGGTLVPDRPAVAPRASHGFPWVPVIVVLGLVFLVIAFMRRRSEAQQSYYEPQPANPYGGQQGFGGPGYGNGPQGGPWPGGYQGGGYPQQGGFPPQQQGGMGGGIMSSLAGGAAAGAGFAAGEAVIGRMFGEHDRERVVERDTSSSRDDDDDDRRYNQDMGGNDFGISDSGSWDDSSSGGGNDDW
ncbi:tetratricopeptide repeat protein [Novosphingobium rosa]|uniref:tetratricopeptide repeat protein n=1 Tax=Novosphingobium rosa TaxID=76978 RepID=UPI000AF57854|nr:tetratricopeptide repeat protein [Novosphingobium rosa]